MEGLKIKCPNCKAICFVTTNKYNPDVTPNGSMVKKLVPWEIDWLCSSTTLAAEMTCPKCGVGQLAPGGRLTVIEPLKVAVNELNVPIRDGSSQLHVEGDTMMIVDPKEFKIINEVSKAMDEDLKSLPGKTEAFLKAETVSGGDAIRVPLAFVCEVCGKVCKNQFGLNGHMTSHKKGES